MNYKISNHSFELVYLSTFLVMVFFALPYDSFSQEKEDYKTEKPIIDMFKENPASIPLDPRDPTYRTGQMANRILRELLTGMALRETGITDPYYIDPLWEDHGSK